MVDAPTQAALDNATDSFYNGLGPAAQSFATAFSVKTGMPVTLAHMAMSQALCKLMCEHVAHAMAATGQPPSEEFYASVIEQMRNGIPVMIAGLTVNDND